MRFLHIADIHLGKQQYHSGERYNDFSRAFWEAIEFALDEKVDAVVIAGDLFDKAAIEPYTLLHAERGLKWLKDEGIPAIAVHGNHDRVRYRAQFSWVEYLNQRGLLCLLSPEFSDPLQLFPWSGETDEDTPEGGYLDIGHVRFVGVPWLGASLPVILAEVADVLPQLDQTGITCTVLVAHAGVEGQMPHLAGGLKFDQLLPLKDQVQYLALGHLHKPYEVDGWVYNPGSLETCSFDENQYDHGAYLVEVAEDGSHQARHIDMVRRPFFSREFKTDLYHTPAELMDAVTGEIQQWSREIKRKLRDYPDPDRERPVLRLILRGHLVFDRTLLNTASIHQLVQQATDALVVRVENRTVPFEADISLVAGLDQAALECTIFAELARSEPSYGVQADRWGSLMGQVKTAVLERAEPQEIYAMIDQLMHDLEAGQDVDH